VTTGAVPRLPSTPFARTVWMVLRKDLTVEMRSGEIAYTTLFFAVSCVLIFAFALVKEGRAPDGGAAGILWIAILFASTLALGRTFERERQAETLRALLLAPVPRPAIYVGKLLGIIALLAAAEVVLLPLVDFLFTARLFAHPAWLIGIVVTCTIGLAAVGTLFAAMLVRTRSRDMLLPVLLYPVVVPVIIAGVQGTSALLQPAFDVAVVRFWLLLLVTFDVVFVVLALWTFEAVMSD
jgi:heme exporter protein CcmB